MDTGEPMFDPALDWLDQKALVELLGVSQQTGSKWAKAGRLRRYEHGFENCGRRRYSRWLVRREQKRRLEQAAHEQDHRMERGDA